MFGMYSIENTYISKFDVWIVFYNFRLYVNSCRCLDLVGKFLGVIFGISLAAG